MTAVPLTPAATPRISWRISALPLALFALLALTPLLARLGSEGFIVALATRTMILALAALSLDLLIGYGGLISFGHAAFIGIGAYSVGILSASGVTDLFAQAAAAMVAAALFALVTGAISLRARGVYFIMITLAFAQMLYFLATSLAAYGGDDGMSLSGRSTILGWGGLGNDKAFFYVVLAILVGAYLSCRMVVASRFGRVLRGARDNPVRMQSIGFSPFRFQLVAYVIAGMIAAAAGVLLANASGFVSPASMAWTRSGDLIFMVVLGGLGTLHGAILGALAFMALEETLSHLTEHWPILFGPILIAAVLFLRGGLARRIEGRAR